MNKLQQKAHKELDGMIAYYSVDPFNRRAVDYNGNCQYITSLGKMCAVGRKLNNKQLDSAKGEDGDVVYLMQHNLCIKTLHGLGVVFWEKLQEYHDSEICWGETGISLHGKSEEESIRNWINNSTIKELQS